MLKFFLIYAFMILDEDRKKKKKKKRERKESESSDSEGMLHMETFSIHM